MKPYGFVTVRVASSRLKKKCLLPFGEGNVLEHVIRRAVFFGFQPVVCTTDQKEDTIIEEIAQKEKVLCFRGSSKDKLKRWLDACDAFHIDAFHTIDADDPFFDGELDQTSFQLLQKKDYDVIYPPKNLYVGSVGFSLKTDLIRKACALKTSDDTEMMWYYLEKVPKIKKMELPVNDVRATDIRLTLDYEEDYWMLLTVLRILGPHATRKEIEDLFVRNPDMYKMNWFRNEAWKQGQLAKKI
jgi:spore coat polysaccharide biosynthesis protein SpsF (cytidylyltransferase family)